MKRTSWGRAGRRDAAPDGEDGPLGTSASRMIRRQRIMLIIAGGATLLSISGLIGSLAIKSPGQAAADRSSVPPSTLTTTVEKDVLQSTVTIRGRVLSMKSVPVRPAFPSSGASAIVTGLPHGVGSAVSSGDVVAQVSGRPVILLSGDTPAYRDMLPGGRGDDIRQLQSALAAIGYLPVAAADGVFGFQTKTALAALYRDRGFEAATTANTDSAGPDPLQAANDELVAAQRRLAQHQLALDAAPADSARAEIVQQIEFDAEDIARATEKRRSVEETTGVRLPLGEVIFIPGGQGVVSTASASIGDDLASTDTVLLTIDIGNLAVYSTVPPGSHSAISPGQTVTISDDVHRLSASGEVTELKPFAKGADSAATSAGDSANTPDGYPMTVTPVEPLDPSWSGRAVRVTVITAATPAPVLIVPTAAIRSTSRGETVVIVVRGGRRVEIAVTTGASDEGRLEVRPRTDGTLAEGDKVVTG